MFFLLIISVGVFSASVMPFFIAPGFLFAALVFLLIIYSWLGKYSFLLFSFLLGLFWGFSSGYKQISMQLPDALDKQQFIIRGSIVGLVEQQDKRLRYKLETDSVVISGIKADYHGDKHIVLNTVLLSWYGENKLKEQLKTGTSWQFVVRLRKPRGMRNQNGFDYQAWLFENGISATGYVVESDLNQIINSSNCSLVCQLFKRANVMRESIRQAIFASNLALRDKAVIAALSVGDKQGLSHWWDDLARFGIVHLMVISGLHIGLIAGLGYWVGSFFGRIVSFCLGFLSPNMGSPSFILIIAPLTAFFAAVAYSFLAGFTLPTQRALVVVCLVMLPKLFFFHLRADTIFVWSLFFIALLQPLAVLGTSFWLSFCAVLVLLLYFSPRIFTGSKIPQLIASQMILFVGMAAPLVLFIGQISWLSMVVNLFAVPIVSIITVPLCLLAGIIYFISPSGAEIVWYWASISITFLWSLLDNIPKDWGIFSFPIANSSILIIALLLAACCFLIPKGFISRWLCLLPLTLLVGFHSSKAPLRLSILDVGQGLAVVAEVHNRLLVYDTGPYYGPKFNAGSGVIAPFIKSRGFNTIDKLIVSHGDMDHSGGFLGLNRSMGVKQNLLAPGYFDKVSTQTSVPKNIWHCDSSVHWVWSYKESYFVDVDPVFFDVLMPIKPLLSESIPDDNNFSCVLLIRWRDKNILLTGDIEKSAETKLLAYYKLPTINILVAPHHGSKTSSSQAFVDRLKPMHVVFSAGYRHHFGHPHRDIVNRYIESGAQLWNTALDGGISFEWDAKGDLSINRARASGLRYWWR
ncbi:MAG: DNA internalization-related competence protein ComEC/Rec2 [Porticoccaceae bacterium]|nr:DNA internalization-related competence protein ComEC/Rec2 [Porticoccaceae bacterium]